MNENFFEILKLSSDAKDKDIQAAIDSYEKILRGKSGSSSLSQEELKAGLALVERMRAWAKDKEQIKVHRTAFIEKQSDAIRAYFSTLPNHYEAYKKEVDSWSKRYRLTSSEIEKLMKENPDHQIIQVKLKGLPDDFIISGFKDMCKHIEALNNSAEINKIWPWAKGIKDFYSFLAHATGKDVNEIRKMDTPMLLKLVEQYRDPMTNQAGGGFGATSKPLRDIFGDMVVVFSTQKPANRTAYDNSIIYETLRPLFDTLKQAPEEARKEDHFVANYLRQIKEKFNNDELALAIYNKEANLLGDPYEPNKVVVSMTCANCGSNTNFDTHEAAKHGKCAICGSPFYIACPSCGELIPASSQTCSHCNFNVIEFRKVGQYFNSAKTALAKGDYGEAHLYLEQAIAADPKNLELRKFPDFETIRQKIEKGYEEYSKYFTALSNLIAAKNFLKAKQEAENVKKNHPNLDIGPHMKKIQEALDKVKNMMPSPTDYSEAAALRCYDILDIVADYLPAKEHLHKVNLSPVENFKVVALQGETFGVSISWSPSKHSRVTYYLVRNEEHMPKTFSDGVLLLKESTSNTFEDSKIQPGKPYYYAAFVAREGVFSPAASARFAYFAEVEKLEATPTATMASLSYSLPVNCIGVKIIRKENAVPAGPNDPSATVICPSTRLPYEDKSVQLDHQYGYLIIAIYADGTGQAYSHGKSCLVRIERDPSDLDNIVIEKNGGAIQVRYKAADPTSPNAVRLYTIKPNLVERKLHNLITTEELQAYISEEKLLGSAKASDGGFAFTLAGDYAYSVALISMTDGKARICGLGFVSSIPTIEVDKPKTSIKDAGKAYVRLKDVPANCFGIHYMVLDASHTKNEITAEDIQRRMTIFVPGDTYRREGLIDARGRAISSGSFKILIQGEFIIGGNHVFGQTTSTVISSLGPRTITYYIKWEKKGLFKKTMNGTLFMTCKGPLPELKLMGKQGAAPISGNDINAYEILEISADNPSLVHSMDNYTIEIPADYCQVGMVYRLFLKEPDGETKVAAGDYASLTCNK